MTRALHVVVMAAAAAGLVGLAGCGGDDGGQVRSEDGTGSQTGSGSGSGSGLSASDLGTTGAKDVEAAAGTYRTYVLTQVTDLQGKVTTFTNAVRAGDIAAAKAAYGPSRVPWEAIEPIAGLVEETDGAVDSRVDDFAGPDDPKFTGWHRLEYLLWEKNTTAGAKPFADRLDKDIATLATKIKDVKITAKAAAVGAGELIEEASKGKITGEEDRYSHTDFYDFGANVAGAKSVLTAFQPVLTTKDGALLGTLNAQFAAAEATLAPYQQGTDGWQPFTALQPADKTKLQGQLGTLAETLAKLPAALGVA